MVSPTEAVANAIAGAPLDVDVLEKLSFDPYLVDELRPSLLPLLAELLATRPAVAAEVPSSLVNVLLRQMTLAEILSATKLSLASLENVILRPVLLNQLVLKARASEDDSLTQQLLQASFGLLAQTDLDGASVSLLEKLTDAVPESAKRHVPFAELATGDATQRARLMELNVRLLRARVVPPLEHLAVSVDADDLLLRGLQVEYVQQLTNFFVDEPRIQPMCQSILYNLAKEYDSTNLLANATEAALATLCRRVEPAFFTLDAQLTLVRAERIGLLARLPARYIVQHHLDVVDQLELSSSTLPAVANVVRSCEGLRRLQLSRSQLMNMSVPSQLAVAAAAMSSPDGAELFARLYPSVLRNAVAAPETEDLRDLKTELELNMRMFGHSVDVGPAVATRASQ